MNVRASAPGKLVLAGDYAVLEGAPAVVLALDTRATVELTACDDESFCVSAPEMDVGHARGQMHGHRMHWQGADATLIERLKLVTCVLEYQAEHGARPLPFDARLDTRAFFAPQDRGKLGLGSSAALAVALAAAIFSLQGKGLPSMDALVAMHRRIQGGRGSGLDIATSLAGGVLAYQLREGKAVVGQIRWPHGLAFCCVWSGRPASTGAALARLAQWRSQSAAAYRQRMRELTVAATAVRAALMAGDDTAVVDGVTACADGLARLGESSGIDIVCAEHRAIADMARHCGVAYKTCGAGCGDVGVAVATDTDRLDHFARQVVASGFLVLDTGIDPQGLEVRTSESCKRRTSWTTYA